MAPTAPRVRQRSWWRRGGRGECPLDDDSRFRCLGCVHVRAGVVCLAFYQLAVQSALGLGLLSQLLLRPSAPEPADQVDFEIRAPPAVAEEAAGPRRETAHHVAFLRATVPEQVVALKLCLVLAVWSAAAWLLFGALKGRPGPLLPFFCFQILDLCTTALKALSTASVGPLRERLVVGGYAPLREELGSVDPQALALVFLLVLLAVLCLKAYFVRVVWAHYQYLRLREGLSFVLRYEEGRCPLALEAGPAAVPPCPPPTDLLPPDYLTATKIPPIPPPPSYSPA